MSFQFQPKMVKKYSDFLKETKLFLEFGLYGQVMSSRPRRVQKKKKKKKESAKKKTKKRRVQKKKKGECTSGAAPRKGNHLK